jgi:hypothetical protein
VKKSFKLPACVGEKHLKKYFFPSKTLFRLGGIYFQCAIVGKKKKKLRFTFFFNLIVEWEVI